MTARDKSPRDVVLNFLRVPHRSCVSKTRLPSRFAIYCKTAFRILFRLSASYLSRIFCETRPTYAFFLRNLRRNRSNGKIANFYKKNLNCSATVVIRRIVYDSLTLLSREVANYVENIGNIFIMICTTLYEINKNNYK